MVSDLGSGKPTLLNGKGLDEKAHMLAHGDVLQLGVLHLQVNVIASPSHGSVVTLHEGTVVLDDPTPGRGQSILIVEDEPETAEIFRLIMERAGFKAHVCREVVSAIRVLNTEYPSAIILDLMLPDIHGLELCRYVRRDVEQSNIPIIVVSAAAKQATINQALQVGADVFLGKPFSMKELVLVVSSLVRWYEVKKPDSQTKQLVSTARLRALPMDVRRDAIVFFVSGYQEPIAIVVPSRITVGRRSGSTSRRPHIDLERYGAFEAGVSRVHAAIVREADGFYIEDLDSSNGTFINNLQIAPHTLTRLENAAEITLGNLPVRVFFFTDDDLVITGGADADEETLQTRPSPAEDSNPSSL
jgi:CheY-like chemotaxis protein